MKQCGEEDQKETISLIGFRLPQSIKVQVYKARIECILSNHMTLITSG